MRRPDGAETGLVLAGAARDLVTTAGGGVAVAATARLTARVGIDHRLAELSTEPEEPGAATLLGRTVGSGFRWAVARALPRHAEAGTPLHLLLDDLPVAALVSYFSLLQAAQREGAATPPLQPTPDVCAGWRRGGSAMRAVTAGGLVPRTVGPPASPLERADDLLSWHHMEPLRADEMRRCRRVDVTTGDVLRIDAMFRDTYVDVTGVERVLHEYSVAAEADPVTLEIRAIEATPHSLPYAECGDAATTADVACGGHLPQLRNLVEQALFGPSSCTHLNDLLRSLGYTAGLAALLT